MISPIPFIAKISADDQAKWLAHLSQALPDEKIIPYEEIAPTDYNNIELAITAAPDPKIFSSMPNLKWVHSLWAGVERMMAEVPDAPFEIVRLEDPEMALKMAEAAVAWTLYLHRDMPIYATQQRARLWKEQPQSRAGGRHIGLIGLGRLGAAAALALHQLHFEVSGWSRTPKTLSEITTYSGADGLGEMLAKIDIAICLIPLTQQTRGLINKQSLKNMRPGASIVNFARGPIIEMDALVEALDEGHIAHAVLDVFNEEPLPQNSPLWTHPSITILPHISGPTNLETASGIVAQNIMAYRATGQIPKSVDKARGY